MSLRRKLWLMLSAFLLLLALFSVGTLWIFENLTINVEHLNAVSDEFKAIAALNADISALTDAVTNWGLTGDQKYRTMFRTKVADIERGFKAVGGFLEDAKGLDEIRSDYRQVLGYANLVMDNRHPIGDQTVFLYAQQMNLMRRETIVGIERLRDLSIGKVIQVANRGEAMKRTMTYYFLGLILFSSLAALLLINRIRSSISEPLDELLKAAEKISGGELSYRIRMKSKDEFGVVADRFDAMASDIEASNRQISRRLSDTELVLDVARIAGTTLVLRDALESMVGIIVSKTGHTDCAVFMARPDLGGFSLVADSSADSRNAHVLVPSDQGIAWEVSSSMGPHFRVIGDEEVPDDALFADSYRSVLVVPIVRGDTCIGILVVRDTVPGIFSKDEVSIFTIIAHTMSAVAQNADLYQSVKNQVQQLSVLYELSKALTSVLDLEELLKRVASEIVRLLSSRGCVIRLIENERLKIKSSFGLPKGVEDEMELSLGNGIAGWVAANGAPLLVEDARTLPADLTVPVIEVKSVICVPLKVGDTVIGTLGLYDKRTPEGELIPFTRDDLATAEGFASISAIAIEKSKIYENEVKREKAARDEKKRMDILFDSVQGGLITLDREYTIISANRFIEEWVGIKGDEMIGKSCVEIFHDKIGICPHCASKATFETGEINSIMQSRGVNYAELTAYPIKGPAGRVEECVVFIQDITERVLYQEETLSLYREVIQTKEYLESIIDNSADAIVSSDISGIITSWNEGAERIFGFAESEAMGKFLPFVPAFLIERERENIERIRQGEVLKDIETLRMKKDGSIIEVSLTLSPIKDAAGEVIGISGISRDISEKKRVENELIRRNQELSRLFFISSAMRGTLELDRLLRMVLIAVTMSDGLGFNRAILFLTDEERNVLKGTMGVGPENPEHAGRVWHDLAVEKKTLDDVMQDVMSLPIRKDSFLDRLSLGLEIPLEGDTVLTEAVREKRPANVLNVREEQKSDAVLIQQLGTEGYAVVPLVARDKVIGVIWVDNYFNKRPITDEDMKFLVSFSNHVASAIENARLFQQVKMAEQQLENIFESMSDMVYFNNSDYVIQSINKAVSSKLGLPASEIIGRKCYEVFHGMHEPYKKCPHHKTVETKKAYIEEIDDPHLGGTFLTSSSPIFDLSGEFIGSVHVVRDITEIRNLREKLVTSEKMAALGEVAAKVAHEIRNPLVSVGGFAKRLEKKLDGNLKEYAGIIAKEVERLEVILKEILGFVQEVRLAREDMDLNALVEDTFALMMSDIEDRGIMVIKELGPPLSVFIDPNRVKEAIVNIVSNAVQSVSGHGAIYVRTFSIGGFAAVEIRDTGKGIPEGDRPYIFNPFFTTKSSGTGLGLAITHKIIQEHGGTIEVESEIDKGSTFRVLLPLKEG